MTPQDIYRLLSRRGRPVTVRREGTPNIDADGVMAWVRSDPLEGVAGDRPMAMREVVIAAADPALATWPQPIAEGDVILLEDGTAHRVMTGTGLKFIGASPARYDLTIQGPV